MTGDRAVDFMEMGKEYKDVWGWDNWEGKKNKIISMWYVYLPSPQDECNNYVWQAYTNK